MYGWDTEDSGEIIVKRRMKVGRRRPARRPVTRVVTIVVVLLVIAGGVAGYFWLNRPKGLETLPNPAVVAPGGFRAVIGDDKTITVGLEVRNMADRPISLTDAKVVPPSGMTVIGVSVAPPGVGNRGFELGGELPAMAPIVLGTEATERNAVVVARFTVDCERLPQPDEPTGEQIFVTIRVDDESRVEELTPPALDDVPWLTGSAQRLCSGDVSTEAPESPLPPLPPEG